MRGPRPSPSRVSTPALAPCQRSTAARCTRSPAGRRARSPGDDRDARGDIRADTLAERTAGFAAYTSSVDPVIRVRLRATDASCRARMKGKDRFSRSEAEGMRRLVDLVRRAEPGPPQKLLRDRLRAMGFYISDFAGGRQGSRARTSTTSSAAAAPPSPTGLRPAWPARGAQPSPRVRVAQRATARDFLRWLSGHVVATGQMKSECSSSVSPHPPGHVLLPTRTPSSTTLRTTPSRRVYLRFGAQTTSSTPSSGWAATWRISPRVPVNHLDLKDREQRRRRRALRAEGIRPLARRMRLWSPLVVAPVVVDMVKTGDITETLCLAGHADVGRAELPSPAGTGTVTSTS